MANSCSLLHLKLSPGFVVLLLISSHRCNKFNVLSQSNFKMHDYIVHFNLFYIICLFSCLLLVTISFQFYEISIVKCEALWTAIVNERCYTNKAYYHYPSIHPSIHLLPLIRGRVAEVSVPAESPKLPFPGHINQL